MNETNKHIGENQHLTSYQISVAADTILANQFEVLDSEVSEHIEICSQCKSDILSLLEVLNHMSNEGVKLSKTPETIEKDKIKGFEWTKWLAAASIAILAIASIVFWQRSNTYHSELVVLQNSVNNSKIGGNYQVVDSLKLELNKQKINQENTVTLFSDSLNQLSTNLEVKSKLLALAYRENKSFEKQMNMDLRSTLIMVKSPKDINLAYGKSVKLSWESDVAMGVAIYNNKGNLILKDSGLKASYLLKSDLLLPGIYYWKLIDAEGVVFIGKILLK